jgi:outer membrane lipoprotein SlyB
VVNLPQLGEQISMTAKMVEVETGSILWQGEGTGNMKSGAGSILGGLGGAVAGGVAGNAVGGYATEGAVVGGIAGATAGYVLQPDEMEQAKKVVVEVCQGLPRK